MKMGVPARLALLAWRAGHRVDDWGMRIENLLKSSWKPETKWQNLNC
jgi:hypothetical protein